MTNHTVINTNDQAYQYCCVHCDDCPCEGEGYSTLSNSGQTPSTFVFITINNNQYGFVCQDTQEPAAHCSMVTGNAGQDYVYIEEPSKLVNISGDPAHSTGCHSIDPLPAITNNNFVYIST